MNKASKVVLVLLLLLFACLFLLNSSTIFQEGNPIPVAYGIIKLSLADSGYAKVDEHKYIVKANDKDIKKLTDYLAQNNLKIVDQMGMGLVFSGKNGNRYTAIKRMYTSAFEIWDFSSQTKKGLDLP